MFWRNLTIAITIAVVVMALGIVVVGLSSEGDSKKEVQKVPAQSGKQFY